MGNWNPGFLGSLFGAMGSADRAPGRTEVDGTNRNMVKPGAGGSDFLTLNVYVDTDALYTSLDN